MKIKNKTIETNKIIVKLTAEEALAVTSLIGKTAETWRLEHGVSPDEEKIISHLYNALANYKPLGYMKRFR